jgi:phosphoglycolate phosphatase-like HAD superfamily hydrolase
MIIVFDMDNTLVDEMGSSLRPGILDLLKKLKADNHELKLWTNSKRDRANSILQEHKLKSYFTNFVFREDYDPEEKGNRKDIRNVKGDYLIDDDPREIQYVKSIGKDGFLISSFRKGSKVKENELNEIYKLIQKNSGFFNKFF